MDGAFDQYPWDGAAWDGVPAPAFINSAHAICVDGAAGWETVVDGAARWATSADAIEIAGAARWEIEIAGEIPEC